MHLRPAFIEHDTARIAGLIKANPFGLLVTQEAGGGGAPAMCGSHVPFVVERQGDTFTLAGHLAAANAQCAALSGGTALAVFTGPHAYIAPGWYLTQPSVPTWDYAAVHVHGRLELIEDETGIADMLKALAAQDPVGFDLDALTPKYRAAMFSGIRSFRLHPERIEAQWKMSQNRSREDRQSVVAGLRALGNAEVADLIEATLTPG